MNSNKNPGWDSPKPWKRFKLCTGRIITLKKPSMATQRMAVTAGTVNGQLNGMLYVQEVIQSLFLDLKRVNGEKVEVLNPAKLLDDILEYDESMQLIEEVDKIMGSKKKPLEEIPIEED